MEHNELKPCPFCGNRAFDNIKYSTRKRKPRHFVKCTKCNAYMEYCNKKTAINAWNRRADDGKGTDN